MKTALLTAAVAVTLGFVGGTQVSRIAEVGRISAILGNAPTYAFGEVHVTVDTLNSGEAGLVLTAPLDHMVGLDGVLFGDAAYQAALRHGLTGGVLYDSEGFIQGALELVVPVPHRDDMLMVVLEDGSWRYLHRTAWARIGGAS